MTVPFPTWLRVIFAAWFALIVVTLVRSLFGGALIVDLGYYLSVAERLGEGLVPNQDFKLIYTPLGLYVMSVVRLLGGHHEPYEAYAAVLNAFNVVFGFCMYAVLTRVTKHEVLRWAGALLAVSQVVYLDGTNIQLETFTIVFTTLATFFALGASGRLSWWALSGVMVACAFFSKQYGVLAGFPLGALALLEAGSVRTRVSRFGAFAVAGSAVGLAYVGYYCGRYGLSVAAVTTPLFTKGYATYAFAPAVRVFVVSYVLKTTPVLLLVPVVFLRGGARRHWRVLSVATAMLALFGATLLVRQFLHYLILVVPFGVMLLIAAADELVEVRRRLAPMAIALAASVVLVCVHLGRLSSRLDPAAREPLDNLAREVSLRVDPAAKTLLVAHPALLFLSHITPVGMQGNGFNFTSFYPEEDLRAGLDAADVAVVDEEYVASLKSLGDPGVLDAALASHGFTSCDHLGTTITVWRRDRCSR